MQTIAINNPSSILDSYIKNFVYNILKVSKKYEQYIVNKTINMDIIYESMISSNNQQKTIETIKTINQAHVINSNHLLNNPNELSLFFSSVPQKVKLYENTNFANTIINIKDTHNIELRDKQTKKVVGEIQLKISPRLYNDTKQLNRFLINKVLPNYNNSKLKQLIILLSYIARNAILPVIKKLTPIINRLKKRFSKESFTYNEMFIILENELTNQDNNQSNNKDTETNNQQQSNDNNNVQDQNIEKTNFFKVVESIIRLVIKVPFLIAKGLVYFVLAIIKLDESYIDKCVDYISLAIRKATIPFLVLLNRASLNELIVEARKNDLLTPTEFKNKVNEIKQQIDQQADTSKQTQQDSQDNNEKNEIDDTNKNNNQDQSNKEKNDTDSSEQNKDNQQKDIQTLLENIEQLINSLDSNVKNTRNQFETHLQENNFDKAKEILYNSINGKKYALNNITQKTKQLISQENFNIYMNFENLNIESYLFYGKKSVIFENISKEQTLDNIIKRVLDILVEDYKNIREIANNYDITNLKSDLNNYLKLLHNLIKNFIRTIVDNNQEKYNYYKSYVEDKIANLSIQNQKTDSKTRDKIENKKKTKSNNKEKTNQDNKTSKITENKAENKKDNQTNNKETSKENNDADKQKKQDVNTDLILESLKPLFDYMLIIDSSSTITEIRNILLDYQKNPNIEIKSDSIIQSIKNSLSLRRTEAIKTGKKLQKNFKHVYKYSEYNNDNTYIVLKNKSFVGNMLSTLFTEIHGLAILAKIDETKSQIYESIIKELFDIIMLITKETFEFDSLDQWEILDHFKHTYKKYTEIDNIDAHITKYIVKTKNH